MNTCELAWFNKILDIVSNEENQIVWRPKFYTDYLEDQVESNDCYYNEVL